jgi:hypothetical protein
VATKMVTVENVEDLALLNEENAIRIVLNGSEKFLAKDGIEGDGARGANSVLAKMVVGTNEGLKGSTEIEVDESLLGVFEVVQLWLALGDPYLRNALDDENESLVLELASYFGLDRLQKSTSTFGRYLNTEGHQQKGPEAV